MNSNRKNEKNKGIENSLDSFLSDDKNNKNVVCKDDVCYVNDGKEIVERIEKKLVTSDGRRLLI
jgi:NADH:ubiquinone oxidoreductase subunit E